MPKHRRLYLNNPIDVFMVVRLFDSSSNGICRYVLDKYNVLTIFHLLNLYRDGDSDIFPSILDFGYTLYFDPQHTRRGGEVRFIIRNNCYLSPSISFPPFSYSDFLSLTLKLPSLTLHLTVIYKL